MGTANSGKSPRSYFAGFTLSGNAEILTLKHGWDPHRPPREGGAFRISLTYDKKTGACKTIPQIDTDHGRFANLVPYEKAVETIEFETDYPALHGEMIFTIALADAPAAAPKWSEGMTTACRIVRRQ